MRTNLRISDSDLRQVLAHQLRLAGMSCSRLVQKKWPEKQAWYDAERFGMRAAIAAVRHERNTCAVRLVCELAAKIHL